MCANYKNSTRSDKGLYASRCLKFLTLACCSLALACFLVPAVNAQDLSLLGMDPGLTRDYSVQTRRGTQFTLGQTAPGDSYQLIAVAEQGSLQDSRPFEIVDAANNGKQDYQSANAGNVSPFFFSWNNDLGSLTATLEIDSLSEAYYYRNRAGLETTPASPALRDQSRIIYRDLPSDIGNASLPQVKNSLDDYVHLAFFEQDSATTSEQIGSLDRLSYTVRLKASKTELDHPHNYQGTSGGRAQLKPGTGSRIVASIHWSEDVNRDGRQEIYLIELNIGGTNNNPAWQSGNLCVKDNASHADVISGQYIVLGGQAFVSSANLPLQENAEEIVTVNWGQILKELRGRSGTGNCALRASLEHTPNTIALGIAIESRGAVQQSVDIAGATIHPEQVNGVSNFARAPSPPPPPPPDPTNEDPVLVQTQQLDTELFPTPVVAAESTQPTVVGSYIEITKGFPLNDSPEWWQVMDVANWQPVCESDETTTLPAPSSFTSETGQNLRCSVAPGRYSVIEHVSGTRWDNLIVLQPATENFARDTGVFEPASGLFYDYRTSELSWQQAGWYQVQSIPDRASICESNSSCIVQPGVYIVINHTSGERWENVFVPN